MKDVSLFLKIMGKEDFEMLLNEQAAKSAEKYKLSEEEIRSQLKSAKRVWEKSGSYIVKSAQKYRFWVELAGDTVKIKSIKSYRSSHTMLMLGRM